MASMQLLYAIALASASALLFAVLPWHVKPKPKPTAPMTYTERIEADTFASRFGDDAPLIRRVRTVSIVPLLAPPEPEPKRAVRVVHEQPARLDICQRHNMRKVQYGRRWRCRK